MSAVIETSNSPKITPTIIMFIFHNQNAIEPYQPRRPIMLKLIEQLANTATFNTQIPNLLTQLPENHRNTYLANDFSQIRKDLSNQATFPDARTVMR